MLLQVLIIWGLIGVHTDKFGFKHVWEIWSALSKLCLITTFLIQLVRLYQAYYGLAVCPWYAYSQTMISEVSPMQQMYAFGYAFVCLQAY